MANVQLMSDDGQPITAFEDSSVYYAIGNVERTSEVIDEIENEMLVVVNGKNVVIKSGMALVYGRFIHNKEDYAINVGTIVTFDGYVGFLVDLTKPIGQQVEGRILTQGEASQYQDDLRKNTGKYFVQLSSININGSAITLNDLRVFSSSTWNQHNTTREVEANVNVNANNFADTTMQVPKLANARPIGIVGSSISGTNGGLVVLAWANVSESGELKFRLRNVGGSSASVKAVITILYERHITR